MSAGSGSQKAQEPRADGDGNPTKAGQRGAGESHEERSANAQTRTWVQLLLKLFGFLHALIALLFVGAAVALLVIAAHTAWLAILEGFEGDAALAVIEAMGLIAVSVVALQIAQTIMEEEVVREAHVSAPTRVRRFLSRFMVVVVVAIAIEALVATFQALHAQNGKLVQAAALLTAVGVLLAGWGVFIKLNCAAEELEPEAMAEAKSEDKKLN